MRKKGELPYFTGRRYGDFLKLHRHLRNEFPGKILPAPPKKNKQSHTTSNLFSSSKGDDSDSSSVSSISTKASVADVSASTTASMRMLAVEGKKHHKDPQQNHSNMVKGHRRSASGQALGADAPSPRTSIDNRSISNSNNTSDHDVRFPTPYLSIFSLPV